VEEINSCTAVRTCDAELQWVYGKRNGSYKVKSPITEHENSPGHGLEEAPMSFSSGGSTRKKISGQWLQLEVEVVQNREPDRRVSIS